MCLWWWTATHRHRHDSRMSQRPEPYSPYCGLLNNDQDQPVKAQGAPHLAISAPTRTGKTRRLLAPAAVLHPGPLVAVSSKEDLAELVLMRRCTGPTGVIDLRPQKTLAWPRGVKMMVSDPTMAITTADEALTVAETMLATSGVGFGGASSSQTVAAGGLWESTASRPLACLLYAASPLGNTQGMPWVLEAVENLGLEDDGNGGMQLSLEASPSWATGRSAMSSPGVLRPHAACSHLQQSHARQRGHHRFQGRHPLGATGFEHIELP